MQRGDLIGVLDARQPRLGVVVATAGQRLTVAQGQAGKLLKHPARSVVLLAALDPHLGTCPQRISDVPWQLSDTVLAAARPKRRDVAAAWLLLSGSGEHLSFTDWVQLAGSGTGATATAAAWLWLQGDQLWFSQRHGLIAARSLQELRLCRRQRHVELLQQAQTKHWQHLLQRRQPLLPSSLNASEQDDLALLRRWAEGDCDQPLHSPLQEALRQAKCPLDSGGIRQLLVDLGQWDRHALPALRSSPWAQGFSPELEALAAERLDQIEALHPGDERRVDRTALHAVTIDDDDTQDIDDALSLELDAEGRQRLWIHIADPGRLITPDDPLDQEAQRRGASLYLARGIEPMFPWVLSTQGLSLRAGQRCAAWSLWVELAGDGSLAHYGIERSWIRPAYRLSYADADELIELAPPQEAALLQLNALMQRRRQWRQSQGALLLDQPEGRIQVDPGGDLSLHVTEPTASRLLVAEAMILAGAVVAEHGAALGLPLPYRSQHPCALPPDTQLLQLAPGPVRHAALKQGLSRGLSGTTPAAHFSLGLQAYVQATSPIRRYGDLLVQRQLASLWDNQAPMSAVALQERLSRLEDPIRQGIQISRDDQRHWRQEWFACHREQQWQAEFLRWLRQSDGLGLVWLEALAMELPALCPPHCDPGTPLLVKVHRVDPLRDCLQLRAHH